MTAEQDARATLEEERDFLLASLDDLEQERSAGDVDDEDYRTLKADYTARAAAVLRALDGGSATSAPEPGTAVAPSRRRTSNRGRRIATIAGVALVAVLAGVLVAQSSGRRGSASLTGLDVRAASSRISQCQELEQSGEVDGALGCYSEVLDVLPANVEALTFRGWLQVREGELEEGLADLDSAVQLAPDATAPLIFRASGRARSGDAPGAVGDLAAFYGNDPEDEEADLADSFATNIVEDALDTCVQGDVDGTLPPAEVLQCYLDILEVDDGNAAASIYLGWLVARSGADDELALRRLTEGLEADPTVTAGYVFRAAVLAHLGDVDAARSDLEAFDSAEAPESQRTAAAQVRAAIDAGEDPLPKRPGG